MRKVTVLAAWMCMLALASCNSRPGSSAAQAWLESYLSTRSQEQFRVSVFSITSSEETVLGGVPSYRMSYTATVVFPNGHQPDCMIRLCMATEGIAPMLPNSIVHLAGELIFQKATNQWVVAPEWAQSPRTVQIELSHELQCNQIADAIRAAMQNESRGASQLPNITAPQESSRSENELRCTMQAELNGRSGTLLARAYEDGTSVRLAISRDQFSGGSPNVTAEPSTPRALANDSNENAARQAADQAVAELQRRAAEAHNARPTPVGVSGTMPSAESGRWSLPVEIIPGYSNCINLAAGSFRVKRDQRSVQYQSTGAEQAFIVFRYPQGQCP